MSVLKDFNGSKIKYVIYLIGKICLFLKNSVSWKELYFKTTTVKFCCCQVQSRRYPRRQKLNAVTDSDVNVSQIVINFKITKLCSVLRSDRIKK